jgi:hypothetical protein
MRGRTGKKKKAAAVLKFHITCRNESEINIHTLQLIFLLTDLRRPVSKSPLAKRCFSNAGGYPQKHIYENPDFNIHA